MNNPEKMYQDINIYQKKAFIDLDKSCRNNLQEHEIWMEEHQIAHDRTLEVIKLKYLIDLRKDEKVTQIVKDNLGFLMRQVKDPDDNIICNNVACSACGIQLLEYKSKNKSIYKLQWLDSEAKRRSCFFKTEELTPKVLKKCFANNGIVVIAPKEDLNNCLAQILAFLVTEKITKRIPESPGWVLGKEGWFWVDENDFTMEGIKYACYR